MNNTIHFGQYLVSNVTLHVPGTGVSTAYCVILGTEAPAVGYSSTLEVDNISWRMVVDSVTTDGGMIKLSLRAGKDTKGGFLKVVERAKNFNNITGRNIINELARLAGETVGSIDPNVLSFESKQYQVVAGVSVGKQLSRFLTRFPGVVWYQDHNGELVVIQIKPNEAVVLPVDHSFVAVGIDGTIRILAHGLDHFPEPNTNVSTEMFPGNLGYFIEEVTLKANSSEIVLSLQKNATTKLFDLLASRGQRDKYQKSYPCTIVKQNSDGVDGKWNGTVQIVPDDVDMRGGGLDRVSIRTLPGTYVQIPNDTKATLMFDSDDPTRPFVCNFYNPTDSNSGLVVSFGKPSQSDFVVLSVPTAQNIQNLFNGFKTIANVIAVPQDGGQAIITALSDWKDENPVDMAATKLKTE